MEKLKRYFFLSITVTAVFILTVLFSSCQRKTSETTPDTYYYTCSMHPEVMEKHEGTCPICGMKLIRVEKSRDTTNAIRLNSTQIKLANITVDTVRMRSISEELVIPGNIVIDENHISVISAKFSGRIDKLYFKTVGATIRKGDKLFEIYSEEILATVRDLRLAAGQERDPLNKDRYQQLKRTARNKLLLWGLGEGQVEELAKNTQMPENIVVYSIVSGYLTEATINEGDYVREGQVIFKVGDNSAVWVEGEVFPSDLGFVHPGMQASIVFGDLTDSPVTGNVDLINPETNPSSTVLGIRVEVRNKNYRLIPGMQAEIRLKKKGKTALVVPLDAVLQGENESTVWIQRPDGSFEPRRVSTGIRNSTEAEILEGVREKEVIVVSGAYLLESDYIFKKDAKPGDTTGNHQGMEM
jgi:membrane fusion protein, copper/silver efflux system